MKHINLYGKFKELKILIKNFLDRISKGVKITILVIGSVASIITIISFQPARLFIKQLAYIFWSLTMIKIPVWIIGLIIIGSLLIYKVIKKKPNLIKDVEQDKISRAYTRLKGIKDNLPENNCIRVYPVTDYHNIIDSIEKETEISLTEFRVPETELIKDWPEPGYYKSTLMSKLDALLSYFEIKYPSEKKTVIDFKPPEKQ